MDVANALVTVVSDAIPEACISIANLREIQSDPGQNELLLAGYRSGILLMSCYKMSPEGVLQEARTSRYPMGSTPVTLKTDPAVPNMALVCCDSKLWRVTYDSFSQAGPTLDRVWFTDVESVSDTPEDFLSLAALNGFTLFFYLFRNAYLFPATSFTTASEPYLHLTSRPTPLHWEATSPDFTGSSSEANSKKNAPARFPSSTPVLTSTWEAYRWNVTARTVNY
jgi:hypothetical protein